MVYRTKIRAAIVSHEHSHLLPPASQSLQHPRSNSQSQERSRSAALQSTTSGTTGNHARGFVPPVASRWLLLLPSAPPLRPLLPVEIFLCCDLNRRASQLPASTRARRHRSTPTSARGLASSRLSALVCWPGGGVRACGADESLVFSQTSGWPPQSTPKGKEGEQRRRAVPTANTPVRVQLRRPTRSGKGTTRHSGDGVDAGRSGGCSRVRHRAGATVNCGRVSTADWERRQRPDQPTEQRGDDSPVGN